MEGVPDRKGKIVRNLLSSLPPFPPIYTFRIRIREVYSVQCVHSTENLNLELPIKPPPQE